MAQDVRSRATMKGFFYGAADRPTAAVIGSWDPLMVPHIELLTNLSRYAARVSRAALVIMLHPPPASLISDSALDWPAYDDVETRVKLIRSCGVDAVLVVAFRRKDLDVPAEEFFHFVGNYAQVSDLFLGARQTIGRGLESSNEMVAKLARQQGTQLIRLPPTKKRNEASQVRRKLRQGELARAVQLVGRPPVWHRPVGKDLQLAWPPGRYIASPVAEPGAATESPGFQVQLRDAGHGHTELNWPEDGYDWLAFTHGPADDILE